MAALDALGDFNFALAREQGNRAHFAQIHAHRIVGLFQRAGGQVELDVFAVFKLEVLVGAELGAIEQVDALGADGRDQVVEVVARANLIRQHVVDFAVGEIALFLAYFDQAFNVVFVYEFFVVFELVVNCQNVPTLSRAKRRFAPFCAPVRGPDPERAKKRFSLENPRAHADTDLRSPAKNEAVSGGFSEQDGCASGFTWVAREPELMDGAKGRASSQRLVEYHNLPRLRQHRCKARRNPEGGLWKRAGQVRPIPVPFLLSLTRQNILRCCKV